VPESDASAVVFRAGRTLLSVAILVSGLWCSFQVPLGELTFAEHMDRIGKTREAEALLHGTRSVVSPLLDEATDRLLGEYIEAPTEASIAVPSRAGAPPRPNGDVARQGLH